MPSESVKPSESPSAEGKKHKDLDREIGEMVSAITHRVTDFHKPAASTDQHLENEDHDHGTRIITLAGTNDGATFRSEQDDKSGKSFDGEPEALSTYVNSNFQAINNSIMFGGSYHANDPGVHMDISEFTDRSDPPQSHDRKCEKKGKKEKKEKKEKKKEKEASKSEHHSD